MRNTAFIVFVSILLALLIGCQSARARLEAKRRQERLQESLFKAIEAKDAEKVGQLIAQGVNVHPLGPDDYAPLHEAVHENNPEITRLLVEAGADVNVKYVQSEAEKEFTGISFDFYQDGETALHWAARHGQEEIVRILLSHAANPNASARDGSTPLHEAARMHHDGVVKQLLEKGASASARGAEGMTPLHMALSSELLLDVEGEVSRTVHLLLNKGAPLDAKDDKGMTPLHRIAKSYGGTYFAELLMERGANVNAVDNEGRTPLDLAEDRDMRYFLQRHDAKTGKELQEEDE